MCSLPAATQLHIRIDLGPEGMAGALFLTLTGSGFDEYTVNTREQILLRGTGVDVAGEHTFVLALDRDVRTLRAVTMRWAPPEPAPGRSSSRAQRLQGAPCLHMVGASNTSAAANVKAVVRGPCVPWRQCAIEVWVRAQ